MKIGILGTGFGSYHAKLYHNMEGVELIKIFGRNPEKLAQLEKELKVKGTCDIDEIIHDPAIDLIDICLPTKEHMHYIIEALKAGKHVFCETPLCYNREEARLIQEAEQVYGKHVFVDLFVKFTPEYQLIREAINKNTYGALKAISIIRNTPPIWGPLGLDKIILDLMLHDLDLAIWFLGKPSDKQVYGVTGKQGEACVKALLSYPNAVAVIEASSMMPKAYPFTVACEAIFDNVSLEYREAFTPDGIVRSCTLYNEDGKQVLNLEGHDPYELAIRHVLECCREEKETILDTASAATAIKLAIELTDTITCR